MILGPFWCEEKSSWVKFELEKQSVTLKTAKRIDETRLTSEWVINDHQEGVWTVYNPAEESTEYYAIKDKTLFKTDGKRSPYAMVSSAKKAPVKQEEKQLLVRKNNSEGDWIHYNYRNIEDNPFINISFAKLTCVADALPLLPEEQDQKRHEIWPEVKGNLRVKAKAEAKKAFLDKNPFGESFQKKEAFQQRLALQLSYLNDDLSRCLIELNPKNFQDLPSYLKALDDVINNPQNTIHQQIVNEAGKTDFEREFGIIEQKAEEKRKYFFAVLAFESNYLSKLYNDFWPNEKKQPTTKIVPNSSNEIDSLAEIEAQPKNTVASFDEKWLDEINLRELRQKGNLQARQASFFNEEQSSILLTAYEQALSACPPENFQNLSSYIETLQAIHTNTENIIYKALNEAARSVQLKGLENLGQELIDPIKEYFFAILDYEIEHLTMSLSQATHPQVVLGKIQSLDGNSFPLSHEEMLLEEEETESSNILSKIQNAVKAAHKKYKQWYDTRLNLSGETIRGSMGFFSLLRHGPNGPVIAQNLANEVNGYSTQEEAISAVNCLLRRSPTFYNSILDGNSLTYNHHSFASFLLDELKNIKNSPWSGISAENNLYKKSEIIELLDTFVESSSSYGASINLV